MAKSKAAEPTSLPAAKPAPARKPRTAAVKTAPAVADAPVEAAAPAPLAEALAPEVAAPVVAAPEVAAPAATAPVVAASAVAVEAVSERYADLAQLGQLSVAAVARANAAVVKGLEEIGQEMAGFAQNSLDHAVSTARALIGARTLADVVALQREFAQSAFEGLLARTARVSEIGLATTSAAFEPLGANVVETVAQLKRRAA